MSELARQGLRIRGDRGHPVVHRALVRYARWLRIHVEFPIRVHAYGRDSGSRTVLPPATGEKR